MNLTENEPRHSVKLKTVKFDGINTRHKISESNLSDCQNISGDAYPCLTPRSGRQTIVSGISGITNLAAPRYKKEAPSSFTGVAGNGFYYEGERFDNIALSDGRKSIARLGSKTYIFPDKVYFDCENREAQLQRMEKSMHLDKIVLSNKHDKETGDLQPVISANFYFGSRFKPGDSIMISGCPEEKNNTVILGSGDIYAPDDRVVSAIVDYIHNSTMYVKLYNRLGQEIGFPLAGAYEGDIYLKTFVPDMKQICANGGRLWGTSVDGQCIFASCKGNAQSFNLTSGGELDSWSAMVDDDTPFTGIIDLNGSVVAFKNDALFQVYGNAPSNFSLKKIDLWGASDERSIAVIGSSVFYLGNHGFYKYSGGNPRLISGQLTRKYTGCVGGSDGQKYYACVTSEDGANDLWVYDPRYEIWYREDCPVFVDFISHNGELYGATSDEFMKMYGGEPCGWYALGKRHTENSFEQKRLGFICIRAEMPEDGSGIINVSARADDGEFESFGSIEGRGFIVRRVPVRLPHCDSYQLRLDGSGAVVIHDVERILV